MPPYSGAHFQVLLKAPSATAHAELITVTARVWESCITNHIPGYPNYQILGRIRNLDVELFGNFPSLEEELLSLDYTVRPFDRSKCMSIYADTEVKDRTLLQKLQDQLYEALRDDKVEIGYGLVAETQEDWVLVVTLDRERYNPENPCPPVLTAVGAEYNTIGYILDNDVFITAGEKQFKRFYLAQPPWVLYKLLDKTIATEYSRHLLEVKQEKQQQHQREKRKAKKLALQKSKGTEQERRGALEANGRDKRMGGKKYRKHEDEDKDDGDINVAVGTADEVTELGIQSLEIAEVKPKTPQSTDTNELVGKKPAKTQQETHKKECAAKKTVWDTPWKKNSGVDEIRKPSWFFSGEDALKDA